MKTKFIAAALAAAALAGLAHAREETQADRDNRLADAMEKRRLKEEAEASRSYIPPAPKPAQAASKPEKKEADKNKAKDKAGSAFIATAPGDKAPQPAAKRKKKKAKS